MNTERLRLALYRLLSRLDRKIVALAWALLVCLPALILRGLSFGRFCIRIPSWPAVVHSLQERLVGVTPLSERRMNAIEAALRRRATEIEARVKGAMAPVAAQFSARVDELRTSIQESASAVAAPSDGDLVAWQTQSLDQLLARHGEQAVELVAEWFQRRMSLTLHSEQMMGTLGLLDGYFVEMLNGEGKTFSVAAAAAAIGMVLENSRAPLQQRWPNATLPHKTVLVTTANDYLVRRDFVWLRRLYEELGIGTGYVLTTMSVHERREMYRATVIYTTGSEYGFDVLRNSCRQVDEPCLSIAPYRCIVDEADQLLLDEAVTPHILSGDPELVSASAIPEAWVQMIAQWLGRYFGENRLYGPLHGHSGELSITPAAQLLIQSRAAKGGGDWETFAKDPTVRFLAVEMAVDVETYWQILGHRPGFPGLAEVHARLKGANMLKVSGRRRKKYRMSRVFERWLGITRWGSLRESLVGSYAVFSALPKLLTAIRLLQPYIDLDDGRQLAELQARLRPHLNLLTAILPRGGLFRAIEDVLLPEILYRSAEQRGGEALWSGVQQILLLNSVENRPPQPLEASPSEWMMKCVFPLLLESIEVVKSLGKQVDAAPEARFLADIVNLLMLFQRALNKYPNAENLLRRIGLKGQGLLPLLAMNRLVDEGGKLTIPGQHVSSFLVSSVCSPRGLGADHPAGKIYQFFSTALWAYFGLKRDRDYVVDGGRIHLVSQVTGRRESSKHYGQNRHPFVLLKEGLPYERPHPTVRELAVSSFVRLCDGLIGVSGTLVSAEEELRWWYRSRNDRGRMAVIQIPPHRPRRLADLGMRYYVNEPAKLRGVVEDVREMHRRGRPVLIITDSVHDSEEIHKYVVEHTRDLGVDIPLLNAVHHEREEEVISRAGVCGAITVATQMAGRGTDITLSSDAAAYGGLHVIITPFPRSERILRQAQGRAARQGDPGSTVVISSLDDWYFRAYDAPGINWLRGSMSDTDAIDLPAFCLEQLHERLGEIAMREGASRRTHSQLDAILSPFRDRVLGWRESLVAGDSSDWLKAVQDVSSVYLRLLSSGRATGLSAWERAIERMVRLLEGPGVTAEAQLDRVSALWPGHLSPDEAALLLRELERISALYPRSHRRRSDADSLESQKAKALGDAMWAALGRIDAKRFASARDGLYKECPKGFDPEMPRLMDYLRGLDRLLVRGIDERIILQFFDAVGPAEQQLMGAKRLLERAVLKAIRESQPGAAVERESWERLAIPRWMQAHGADAFEGGCGATAAEVLTGWFNSLGNETRYRCRGSLIRIIDAVWSELLDNVSVAESDVYRTWGGDAEAVRLELVKTVTDVASQWQNECAVRLVEECQRMLEQGSTTGAADRDKELPPTAVQTIESALAASR